MRKSSNEMDAEKLSKYLFDIFLHELLFISLELLQN